MEQLEKNIAAAIKRMKKSGTTGASLDCLKQNTSTSGLTMSVPAYHASFAEVAAKVAAKMKFQICA